MSRRPQGGFDRIRTPEQRLGERPRREGADPSDPRGRAALFSASDTAPRAGGPVAGVHCARCGASSVMDLPTLLHSLCPLFLFVPWLPHPLFAICPACGRRSWLRPRWPPLSEREPSAFPAHGSGAGNGRVREGGRSPADG